MIKIIFYKIILIIILVFLQIPCQKLKNTQKNKNILYFAVKEENKNTQDHQGG